MSPTRSRRARWIALTLSGPFPGLGQFSNGEPAKGPLLLVAGTVLTSCSNVPRWARSSGLTPELAPPLIALAGLLVVWGLSLADAWLRAGQRDRDRDATPRPSEATAPSGVKAAR